MFEELAAIIIIYKQAPVDNITMGSLLESKRLSHEVLDVIIFDNSPTMTNPISNEFKLTYLHDPTNPGVSKAYNEAAKIAKNMGKKWLLLLDQDTTFPHNALQQYATAVLRNPEERMFAPVLKSGPITVSPCAVYSGIGIPLRKQLRGRLPLRHRSVLNSGMLVSLDAFEAIGGFDENIPLDFADHDFCRRFARRFGTAFILDMVCEHGFSDREKSSLESDLARFAFYCRGARNSIASAPDAAGHTLAVVTRCLVLCRRHRTRRFWSILRREYLKA